MLWDDEDDNDNDDDSQFGTKVTYKNFLLKVFHFAVKIYVVQMITNVFLTKIHWLHYQIKLQRKSVSVLRDSNMGGVCLSVCLYHTHTLTSFDISSTPTRLPVYGHIRLSLTP